MAKLQATSLKVIGNASSGIDIEIKTDIVFSKLDKQLDVIYYIQGFVYDVDGEEDIMMPLINELHCQLDVEQVKDSYSNEDDMIYNKLGKSYKASNGNATARFKFQLQKDPSSVRPGNFLVSNKVIEALRDEKDGYALELKAMFVLTNELNGIAISRSKEVSVSIMDQYNS
ncbi:hypothetical protein [Dokdonia sp. PRO95]|uniref:hypothetical protein n=1 Tax=Dokdonia sp. PRO95 TaxID=1239415 RepID=UPI00054CDDBB|nr:hypothetical protein [Dokdonia sp. PRO95]